MLRRHLIPEESGINDVNKLTRATLLSNLMDDFGDPWNIETPKITSTREPHAPLDHV